MKIGDKVVYNNYSEYINLDKMLKRDSIYTISKFSNNEFNTSENPNDKEFYHFEESGTTGFNKRYFTPVLECRKLKIEKLKEIIHGNR